MSRIKVTIIDNKIREFSIIRLLRLIYNKMLSYRRETALQGAL